MNLSSRNIDRIDALFDDPNSVANAGLILVGTPIKRLGLEASINEWVRLDATRPGAASPGRKVLTMVCAIVAGGVCAIVAGGEPTSIMWTCCAPGPRDGCCRSG